MQQRRIPPVAYGDSTLWDGAFGMEEKFPAKAQTFRRASFALSGAPAPAPPKGEPSR